MKNRKFIIIAFVLISAMVVGVGYAALSDTLTITGDLEIDETKADLAFEDDVYFTGTPLITSTAADGTTAIDPNDTQKLSASIVANDNDKITFTAKNMWQEIGQTVTIVATITNTGTNADKDAVLSLKVTGATGNDYFEGVSKVITLTNDDGSTTDVDMSVAGATATLPAGDTCTLTIVFKCIAMPTTTSAATVTYEITANAAE